MTTHRPRRLRLPAAALAGLLLLTGTAMASAASPQPAQTGEGSGAPKPTIVLVHGAFADSSGWNAVAGRLLGDRFPVIAFSNPLRGPTADAEYLRQFLSTIDGPVVLVGHSYGGAVITNAATGNPNVKSLVFIAAYALAAGESVAARTAWAVGTLTSSTTWSSVPSPARPPVTPMPTSTPHTSPPSSPRTCRSRPLGSWPRPSAPAPWPRS